MPVISSQPALKKEKVKIEIDADLLKEISKYMEYATINDYSHFFTEASYFVFSKDKEWKKLRQKAKEKSK